MVAGQVLARYALAQLVVRLGVLCVVLVLVPVAQPFRQWVLHAALPLMVGAALLTTLCCAYVATLVTVPVDVLAVCVLALTLLFAAAVVAYAVVYGVRGPVPRYAYHWLAEWLGT